MVKKVKKVEEVKAPSRLYIEYNRHENGGDAIDPDDRWSSRTERNITVDFIRLHRQQPTNRFFYDSVEVSNEKMLECEKLFLVVVRYGTGDTFGHTNGAWHVVGVAPTYQIANLMLEEALKPGTGYKPWEGYFESYEGSEIHELSVV